MFFLQKRKKEDNKETTAASIHNPEEKAITGENSEAKNLTLSIKKDINELNLPENCSVELGPGNDLFNFKLIVCPDEGFHKYGRIIFSFKVGVNYPKEPPKVTCDVNIYHPNIDLKGNVCLNILGPDWRENFSISSVVHELINLVLEPTIKDPLNTGAANDLRNNPQLFKRNAFRAIRGGYIDTVYYKGHSNNPLYTYRLEKTKKEDVQRKTNRYLGAQKRATKDWYELSLPDCCKIEQGPSMDFMKFNIIISPDEGYYEMGNFSFYIEIGDSYPYSPPKVRCETMIFHPNIDIFGNVCLKILDEDWKPEYSISSIITSLILLLLEPSHVDPVNQVAADTLLKGKGIYFKTVLNTIMGEEVDSVFYEPCLNSEKYDRILQEEDEEG